MTLMITRLNEWRKHNEMFLAPKDYKYKFPEQVDVQKLKDIVDDMFGGVDDKWITMEDLRHAVLDNVNAMQMTNDWLLKFKQMLIDDGWTVTGTCRAI